MRLSPRQLRLFASATSEALQELSKFQPTPCSMRRILECSRPCNVGESYKFLRAEAPVRLANAIQEMEILSVPLFETASAHCIPKRIESDFNQFLRLPKAPNGEADIMEMAKLCELHLSTLSSINLSVFHGLRDLRDEAHMDVVSDSRVQYFMERISILCISLRLLSHHYLIAAGKEKSCTGIIHEEFDVKSFITAVYEELRPLCEMNYHGCPDLTLHLINGIAPGMPIRTNIVPSHLHYILTEIFKGVLGKDSLLLKVCLQVGGSGIGARFWWCTTDVCNEDPAFPPMAGFGCGLPKCRVYARYFGGDLSVMSAYGVGAEVSIRITTDADIGYERIPICNATARRKLSKLDEGHDWIEGPNKTRFN